MPTPWGVSWGDTVSRRGVTASRGDAAGPSWGRRSCGGTKSPPGLLRMTHRRGAGDGRGEPEPPAAPHTPPGDSNGPVSLRALGRALPGIPGSSPAKWGAWYAAQTCSHYCPAADLGTGSSFCQTINGVGDCCCFISSDIGLNICQTREPLFRLYYLRREYINTAEAVKIHSSIIIWLIFEKCLLWNYFISKKKKFYVSVFYNGYLWARGEISKSSKYFQ